jgi:sugar lactone lactonase YvrE
VEGWAKLPAGWEWGVIVAVACDSRDRVFVGSRSDHPLVVFDREGNFLEEWGAGIVDGAHGLYADGEDNVYCTVHSSHCIYKFNTNGKLVMTLGTPGQPAEHEGDPFNKPTDVAVASNGEVFVSDGYVNARVHRFSADGELLHSWGTPGAGPGQFENSHCVRLDNGDRVWVCDRENRRIQIFDMNGNLLDEWGGLRRPNGLHFDREAGVVFVSEIEQQVSIFTLAGELLTKWGGGAKSDRPGEFQGGPHGIWVDAHGDLYVTEALVDGRMHKYVRQ